MGERDFMTAMGESVKQELEDFGTRVHFPVDHVLFVERQPVHSVLIIERGHVAVSHTAEDGTEVVLAFRGPGEPLGLDAVVTEGLQYVKARTVSDVEVLDVPADRFMDLLEKHGKLASLLQFFVDRLRESSEERSRQGRLTVRARFAYLLAQLAGDAGVATDEGVVIDMSLSQADLATRIGSSRESVVKLLKVWRDLGAIETGRRKLVIYDLPYLKRMASGGTDLWGRGYEH
ncbi:Crp/Fnr family transcriptional regulator [Streptomyces bauhiniae]|uniref:Crp/Fnr family transcriptional regulator n=1 Tax=Streptomyces bauhiniae TaxID=2340725 RepID=UPI0037D5414B